jgi:hypothetical protein
MNQVKFDMQSGKFLGIVNGRVVVKSTSEYYVKRRVEEASRSVVQTETVKTESEFGINDRFRFLSMAVKMVGRGQLPSAVITGEGGLGKTYTVMSSMDELGLRNVTELADFEIGDQVLKSKMFRVVKGYSTAKGLYRTLHDFNGMTIVFDDCDSILRDDTARNILKSALDSYSKRYISWNADMRDDDLPRSFEFTGRIIFISNKTMETLDQAIRTRALCIDVSMSEVQKIERMEEIVKQDSFLPEVDRQAKDLAMTFLRDMVGKVGNLSLRSLIQVSKIAEEGGDWKPFAKYALTQGQ